MPELSFKEWVERKVEEDCKSVDAWKRDEWLRAYGRLKDLIYQWLEEDAGEQVILREEAIQRHERSLGIYDVDGFWIQIGNSSVHVVPIGRSVMASINPPEGGELPGQGRVDIVGGGRKYHLYRTIQDGEDRWYVADPERHPLADRRREPDLPLTRERFQRILVDLMS